MTLAFLGDIEAPQLETLLADIDSLPPLGRCHWQSQYLGDFPSSCKAKVLACYSDDVSPSLRHILLAVEQITWVAGAIRRPFRPHVTLAPIKKATAIQRPFLQDWSFDRLCLYQSTAGKPKYKVLTQCSLI